MDVILVIPASRGDQWVCSLLIVVCCYSCTGQCLVRVNWQSWHHTSPRSVSWLTTTHHQEGEHVWAAGITLNNLSWYSSDGSFISIKDLLRSIIFFDHCNVDQTWVSFVSLTMSVCATFDFSDLNFVTVKLCVFLSPGCVPLPQSRPYCSPTLDGGVCSTLVSFPIPLESKNLDWYQFVRLRFWVIQHGRWVTAVCVHGVQLNWL